MLSTRRSDVDFIVTGSLELERFPCLEMAGFHQHNDIEVGYFEDSPVPFCSGNRHVIVPRRRLAAIWSLIPHRNFATRKDGAGWSLNIPFHTFLSWQLPENLKRALLHGEIIVDPDERNSQEDLQSLARWNRELQSKEADLLESTGLELRARLLRLAHAMRQTGSGYTEASAPNSEPDLGRFEAMVRYIAENYLRPIQVTDIAAAAGLHPKYAMRLFRRICGTTLLQYLTQHRVWHAQRLLMSTMLSMDRIAELSGFGSLSRFHDIFKRLCHMSPGEYRAKYLLGEHP